MKQWEKCRWEGSLNNVSSADLQLVVCGFRSFNIFLIIPSGLCKSLTYLLWIKGYVNTFKEKVAYYIFVIIVIWGVISISCLSTNTYLQIVIIIYTEWSQSCPRSLPAHQRVLQRWVNQSLSLLSIFLSCVLVFELKLATMDNVFQLLNPVTTRRIKISTCLNTLYWILW